MSLARMVGPARGWPMSRTNSPRRRSESEDTVPWTSTCVVESVLTSMFSTKLRGAAARPTGRPRAIPPGAACLAGVARARWRPPPDQPRTAARAAGSHGEQDDERRSSTGEAENESHLLPPIIEDTSTSSALHPRRRGDQLTASHTASTDRNGLGAPSLCRCSSQ